MELQPCTQCRRHIASDARSCPFCAAAQATSITMRVVRSSGRLSRAAVFAGAAACASSTPPPKPPPVEAPFVVPPAPAPGRASLSGVVRQEGRRLPGVRVLLQGPTSRDTTTNSDGVYTFSDIEPGSYTVIVMAAYRGSHRFAPPDPTVELGNDMNRRFDIDAPGPPQQDSGPCCKPYGAPPARRRLV